MLTRAQHYVTRHHFSTKVLEYDGQSKELTDALEKGEQTKEQLQKLQSKFGVTQAKLRNMDIAVTINSPSVYGSKKGWKKSSPSAQRTPGDRESSGRSKHPLATENLRENTDRVLHQRSHLGRRRRGRGRGCHRVAACYLLFMLTRATLLMPSFHRL